LGDINKQITFQTSLARISHEEFILVLKTKKKLSKIVRKKTWRLESSFPTKGVQNQDKQSATAAALNLTFMRDFSVKDKRYREVFGKKWNEMEKK